VKGMNDEFRTSIKNKPVGKVFPEEAKRVEEGKCPFCKIEIKKEDFRDDESIREYQISGLCQKCQDKVFGR